MNLESRIARLEQRRQRPSSAVADAARRKVFELLTGPGAGDYAERIERAAERGSPLHVKLLESLRRALGADSKTTP